MHAPGSCRFITKRRKYQVILINEPDEKEDIIINGVEYVRMGNFTVRKHCPLSSPYDVPRAPDWQPIEAKGFMLIDFPKGEVTTYHYNGDKPTVTKL